MTIKKHCNQVYRAIAPAMMPQQSQSAPIIVQPSSSEMEMAVEHNASVMKKYEATLRKLEQRLEEPFVTVNTVTGNSGIKHAQDEYEKLMKNKSPKKW